MWTDRDAAAHERETGENAPPGQGGWKQVLRNELRRTEMRSLSWPVSLPVRQVPVVVPNGMAACRLTIPLAALVIMPAIPTAGLAWSSGIILVV